MIYDVRVDAVLDGDQEIYANYQGIEAPSAQAAAEQTLRGRFIDGTTGDEGADEEWYDSDNDECVSWGFDGEHSVEINPVVRVTQTVTVDHKATITIITE